MYAGVNGAQTQLGNPQRVKFSPRAGAVFKVNDATVVRGGYGVFWAPTSSGPVNSVGYSQTTNLVQNTQVPITTHRQPVPDGLPPADGQHARAGVGRQQLGLASSIRIARRPRVQKYSVDLQRELPGQ